MGSRILYLIIAVVLVVSGFYLYQHYKQQKALDSGAVTCIGCMTPDQKARFDRENHGETADGQSEHKNESARQSAAEIASTPTQMPPQDVAQGTAREPLPQRVGQDIRTDTARLDSHFNNGAADITSSQAGAPPAYDTASPNAPNGTRFAGSGTYQWYRQGNLTWRIDTNTGRSCIVYATMDEWRKQIVSSHGCGRSA